MGQQKLNNIIGWSLGLMAFIVYLLTLEPVASFWDSGEYIASSYKLEIPHPPGAPLFLLLGRLFSFLSFGDPQKVAWAVNTLSALSSALAITFLYWTIVRIAQKITSEENQYNHLSMGAGVVGALTLAFSTTFWYSATETELYGIATLFIAIVFWAIFKWEQQTDEAQANRWLLLICYVIGLSVGIHLLSLLAIPSLGLVYYFKKSARPTKRGVFLALMCSGFFLLFVLYGLVTMANISKLLEILLVNSFELPVGSGVVLLTIAMLTLLIWGIIHSLKMKKVYLNTILLGAVFVIIGYSSYGVILIRANFGPPINQNDPKDVLGLIYYLNLEQYPTRPLLYGNYFNAPLIGYEKGKPIYEQIEGKYQVKDHKLGYRYAEGYQTIFPRAYNNQRKQYASEYRRIIGLRKGEIPKFSDNLYYMLSHQMGRMYLRYLLWNFSGKGGSMEGADWLAPWDYFDRIPTIWKNDPGRDHYFMIPLIFGLIGFFFLLQKDKKLALVVGMLFFMTGFALVLYLNSPPSEPRERDYIYVGSYYAFSIWVGLGALALASLLSRVVRRFDSGEVSKMALIASVFVPIFLCFQNYDDHDRSERFFSVEQARNTLAACEPNAVLFTGGDNDTYPLWYVQEVEGFRDDVRVVVLSYANVDWYINALFEEKNQSAPLPLTLTKEDYKQGSLIDYAPVLEQAGSEGRSIAVSKYLQLINKKHAGITQETEVGKTAVIPARQFLSLIDTSSLSDQENIPKVAYNLLNDRFEYTVKGRGLEKKDLLIMDLIDSNRWERPIYFNNTSLRQVNLDFSNKLVQVGDVFRLLPLRGDIKGGSPLIDTAKMYRNLIGRSSYTNLAKKGVPYSGYYEFFVRNHRMHFNDLTKQLINDGDLDTAREVLNKNLEFFPDEVIPMELASIELVKNALKLEEKDTAHYVARRVMERVEDWLEYAQSDKDLLEARETQVSYLLLNEFTRAFYQAEELGVAKECSDLLEKYYKPS